MPDDRWKLPFNIAVGIHLLAILGTIYLPGIFKAQPKFADIYTVSLVNISAPVSQPEPAKSVEEETVIQPKKDPSVVSTKVAPIVKTVVKTPPSPKKAISIKPLKRKKIKRNPIKTRSNELAQKRRNELAAAIRAENFAEEEARLAQEALERELELMKSTANAKAISQTQSPVAKTSPPQQRVGGSSNRIESQYHAAIFGKLHQYWSLPEYMQKDPNLTAVVVITIKIDGEIADIVFESKSGDRVFDQFVTKTINNASPLPPIPPAMKKQRYEVGLRFKPGSIH